MKIHRNAKTNVYQRRLLIARVRGIGWEYLHVAIDDATRLAYVEVLPADTGEACAAFLRRALVWYRRCGIAIRRLLTDNAMAYRGHAVAGRVPRVGAPSSLHAPVPAANKDSGFILHAFLTM